MIDDSLRWPTTWEKSGYDVKLTEVEGAGHRDILEKKACLETCILEACSPPVKYLEIILESIKYNSRATCCSICYACCCCCCYCMSKYCLGIGKDSKFVALEWHGVTFTSEPVLGTWFGMDRKIESKRRFVLGVSQQDLDRHNTIDLNIRHATQARISSGPIADRTSEMKVKISDLLKKGATSNGVQTVNMGSSRSQIKWSWRWGAATATGKPKFS